MSDQKGMKRDKKIILFDQRQKKVKGKYMSKKGKSGHRHYYELCDNHPRVVFRERVEERKTVFDDEDD